MKKSFLLLLGLLVAGMITTFSQNDMILNPRVEETFKKEFPEAQFVRWTEGTDYSRVDFVLMDYRLGALFSNDGQLLETHRDLIYNQLPLTVMKGLEKDFPEADFSQIEEISNSDGTKYKLQVETKKRYYTVLATADGTISIVERSKK